VSGMSLNSGCNRVVIWKAGANKAKRGISEVSGAALCRCGGTVCCSAMARNGAGWYDATSRKEQGVFEIEIDNSLAIFKIILPGIFRTILLTLRP
jgi:hypothetical protein